MYITCSSFLIYYDIFHELRKFFPLNSIFKIKKFYKKVTLSKILLKK